MCGSGPFFRPFFGLKNGLKWLLRFLGGEAFPVPPHWPELLAHPPTPTINSYKQFLCYLLNSSKSMCGSGPFFLPFFGLKNGLKWLLRFLGGRHFPSPAHWPELLAYPQTPTINSYQTISLLSSKLEQIDVWVGAIF